MLRFLSAIAVLSLVSLSACAEPAALSCTGTAPFITTEEGPRTIPVTCTDGRKGAVLAIVGPGSMTGRLRLNDGTEADFIVGDAAKNF